MVMIAGVLCHHRPMTAAAPAAMTNSTSRGMTSRAVPRLGASGLPGAAGRGRGPGSAAARTGAAVAGFPEGIPAGGAGHTGGADGWGPDGCPGRNPCRGMTGCWVVVRPPAGQPRPAGCRPPGYRPFG